MQKRSPPKTDDEFVESVRKTVARFDRLRTWLIPLLAVLHLAPVVGMLIVVTFFHGMNERIANPGNNPKTQIVWLYFTMGVGLGLTVGHGILSCFTLKAKFVSGMRTERLLLRYYDAYKDAVARSPIR